MQLSRNFSLEQLTHSDTAVERCIDNTPPPETVENLRRLASGLEGVMARLCHPLLISSGFRCTELNTAVGGSPQSQHCLGLAADFTCPEFGSPLEIAQALAESDIEFDQCILEFGRWVHISFSQNPRGRLLTIYDTNSGYLDGLWDREGKQLVS
jgi:zinc D-Ala-D-Ala carboxypeptidase